MGRLIAVGCTLSLMLAACGGDDEEGETQAATATTEAVPGRTIALPEGGTLVIVAGNGTSGFASDGGPATEAQLHLPFGLAWDADGNIYIGQDWRISKVDAATGVISTVAGTGTQGYSGDGGPATEAELGRVQELAFDSQGNLYFVDNTSSTIRRIDTEGVITTVAGTGTAGLSPDGTPATEAAFSYLFGLAFDSVGTLYFSDGNNHLVRKIEPDGTLTTVAGTGKVGESGDGGPATEAQLAFPRGLFIDTVGNLYIGTHGGSRIRMVDTSGVISTVAERGGSIASVAVDSAGNLYISDYDRGAVIRLSTDGMLEELLDSITIDLGDGAETRILAGYVTLDPEGNIYVSDDRSSFRVYLFEP